MKLKAFVCFLSLASAGVTSFGAAYTGGQCASADLVHRWSFNGDFRDAVGGIEAVSLGRYSWNDTLVPTSVKLPGGGRGSSGISFGAGVFPCTDAPFTIEIWATQNEVRSWSRLLDINYDNNNYFCMAWTTGTTLASDRVEFKLSGTATTTDGTMQPYTLNTPYHISVTFTPRADGKIDIAWARRNVTTGAIEKSGSKPTSSLCPISKLATWNFQLGRSPFTSDNDGCATYDEVRVWKGALTAEQLDWSAKLGPDILPTTEPAAYETTVTAASADPALGTVAIEAGAAAATNTATTAYDNNLALVATPAAGAFFLRWTGATDAIVSGSVATAAIAVRTQKPIALTAEFVSAAEPMTALWTGAGAAGDLADAANWTCRNLAGAVLAGVCPTARTAITVTGATAFACPAGSALACASLTFTNCSFTADCDLRGLPVAPTFTGTSELNGHDLLTAKGFAGTGTLDTPFGLDTAAAQPAILQTACFWLDAADASTLTKDADGNVTKWTSKDSAHVVATAGTKKPVYSTTLVPGRPTVDFGAVGSGIDMTYARFTKLRTVFWVIKIVNSGCNAFLLGDANGGSGVYNFHRGDGAQYGHSKYGKFASVWERQEVTSWSGDVPNAARFHILSATMSQDCCSDSLTQDRAIAARNGGRQLSELICFDTVLDDADRRAVVTYLEKKWYPESAVAEVRVEVPADATATNPGVSFTGPVRLVKDGAGLYQPTANNTTYEGGTHIKAGTLKAWTSHYPVGFDDAMTIEPDGTLDIDGWPVTGGRVGASSLRHVLNGGAVLNGSGGDLTPGWTMLGNLALTADSTIRARNSFGLIGGGYRAIDTFLNGHTLDIALADGKRFYVYNTLFTNGTVRVPSTTGVLDINKTSLRAATADFDLDCRIAMYVAGTVRDLTWRGTNTATEGTAALTVGGVFTPLGDAFPNVTLANGATLDLSSKTKPWSVASTCGRTCSFAANAAVTVDIHGRAPAVGERLIVWTTQPTATFQWDAATAAREGVAAPTARADGLYYGPVEDSSVAMTATWTGAAGDGDLANVANWSCTNAGGVAVADVLPGLDTAITVPADKLPQVPAATPLVCRSFTVTGGTLAGDVDLRGLSVTPVLSGTTDLAGHVLTLPGLAGSGAITNALDEGTELITNGSFEQYTGSPANTTYGYFGTSSLKATGWTGASGITQPNNIWTANSRAVPDGSWALFIQSDGTSISQTVTVPADGTYHLAFSFALRKGNSALRLDVRVDDRTVGFVPNNNEAWQRENMLLTLTAGTHTIGFKNVCAVGTGDRSSLVDLVSLRQLKSFAEVRVDVPDGVTAVNGGVALAGGLKLVKLGAGTQQMSKTAQTYLAGTEVRAGTLKAGAAGISTPCGLSGTPITVAAGATFDTVGYADFYRYYFVLDGGRLVNTGTNQGNGIAQIAHVRLTADSVLSCQDFIGSGYMMCDFELNGFTVTHEDTASASVFYYNTQVLNGGTVKMTGVVNLYFDKYRSVTPNVNWDVNGALHLVVDVQAKDFTLPYVGNWHSGTAKMVVAGTFKPFSSYYPNVQLQKDAKLDLSELSEPLVTPSIDQRNGSFSLTFVTNSTITIETGSRVFAKGERLIAWPSIPSDVRFALAAACAEANPEALVPQPDGLYYGCDPAEVVDATWTGAAGTGDIADPGNWTCRNALGATVADVLPGDKAVVHITGACAPQIPVGASLAYATLDLGDVRLTADCDWRGFTGSFSGKVNLNGHRLTVAHLTGSGLLYGSYVRNTTGYMTTGEQLVWRGLRLADVASFVGTLEGAWISEHTVTGLVVAQTATSRTVQFQVYEQPHTKMTEVLITEKSDGLWVKSLRSGYVTDANKSYVGTVINASNGSIATSASANGYGVFDLKVTVTPDQSELHLDTDGSVGSAVEIAGKLKFVKEGTGTYVAMRNNQFYEGGTEIAAGTVIPGRVGTDYPLGRAEGAHITIDPGATFDFCGSYYYTVYQFRLNGGLLKNSRAADYACQFGNTVLLADSTWAPQYDSQFWENHTLDLGGHTLAVPIGNGRTFTFGGSITNGTSKITMTRGVLDVTTGGWLKTVSYLTVNAQTATWRIGSALNINSAVNLGTYEALYGANYNAGTNVIGVVGAFIPHTAYFHGLELKDGATLDLTQRPLPWSTKSAFTSGANVCAFASNATIRVKLGADFLPAGGKIVDWTGRTPAGLDTIAFRHAADSAKAGHFMKKADGLYLQTGIVLFIR